jgi:hypothetical protein
VREVLEIGDDERVLRNYWVTQSYSDLSRALTKLLARNTANWCTFGTWASCTVGRNLRGEDLPGWLHDRVVMADGMMGVTEKANGQVRERGFDRLLHDLTPDHVGHVVRELFGACAHNLSEGNTEVFKEIGPAAATFIEVFGADPVDRKAARVSVFEACEGAPEFEGRNRLHDGMALWCDAIDETDDTRRSQLILAGSLELGAHEQHHLQGAIAGAMDMGMNQSAAALKQRLARVSGSSELREVEGEIDVLLGPVVAAVSRVWGDLMTELLGTIVTPDGTLRLNHDVPPVGTQLFRPAELEPVVVDELAALLKRFSRAEPDGTGSKAPDWVSLDDRMNFISNLFVSRHHRVELLAPPFPPDVVADIEAGRIPTATDEPPAKAGRPAPAIPPSRGKAKFTDAYVEHLRQIGDPPADAAVDEFFRVTQKEHTHLLRHMVDGAAAHAASDEAGAGDRAAAEKAAGPTSDEDLPGIGPFVRAQEPWPTWADPDLVREGQQLFGDYGLQLGMGLFMASLPSDYGFGKGVQALARTHRLTEHGDAKRRYVETGQMIIEAMTPGGLDPGAKGYRTVRHVRLMHAAVRHVLAHLDEIEQPDPPIEPWKKDFGLPISQVQLLGTLFSFSVEGIKALRRAGIRVSDRQAEAYIHVWNLVGHQIGILDEILPLSWPDSFSLWEERRKLEHKQTPEGTELTLAAIDAMNELFALPSQMKGLPATGIRHFLGDETAELLGVPPGDWTKVIFEVMSRTDGLYEIALIRLPGTAPIASILGRRLWRGFEMYGRKGGRPKFEVTAELRSAWGM